MMFLSDSQGTVYPAPGRLDRAGLVKSQIEEGGGLRRRRVFSLTPQGLRELKRWAVKPVIRQELIWSED
jgi:DNA-binding PadR family transcriptional regulator